MPNDRLALQKVKRWNEYLKKHKTKEHYDKA